MVDYGEAAGKYYWLYWMYRHVRAAVIDEHWLLCDFSKSIIFVGTAFKWG